MKPTKTILLVLLVSFGLNTVAQVAINTNEKASNNKSAIQADAAIASGQKTTHQSINPDTTFNNISIQSKDNCIPPKDLTVTLENDNLAHLLWDTIFLVDEWIYYHDGSFENSFCSTEGGAGLAQVFTPEEYPITVTKVAYYNDDYGIPGQENEVYVLTGDGSTVLAGPYSVTGEYGDTWVPVDIDDVKLESGTFMVYTANVAPDGPYIGVDDSFYNGTLYYGTVGAFTELGTYGYYYVGSHEASVIYGDLSTNAAPNSAILRPTNHALNNSPTMAVSNHVSDKVERPFDNKQTRSPLGYNIYLDDDLIEALWPYNFYSHNFNVVEMCYTVTSEYNNCESDPSNEVCFHLESIDEIGENEVSLYPNPASNYITLTSIHKITRITLTNYIGQIVYVEDVNGDSRVELNTNSYPAGVYLVKIETESGVVTKRIIIRR